MITLLNAAPDTGNQGVSALCHATVSGLARRGASEITVADHGRGLRQADWGHATVNLVGLTHSRRFWRGDNLRAAHVWTRAGGGPNAPARTVARSRAVLDISGGDSFTDVYGPKRFRAMILTKRLALNAGVPLILLPQKLGPFSNPAFKAEAVAVLRAASAVWVRDTLSFKFLLDALGADFNPDRHRLGVDVAVALPQARPIGLKSSVSSWLQASRNFPLAGLNVSGLLCNDREAARQNFGLRDLHTNQTVALSQRLLKQHPDLRLLLIPHVHRPGGDAESDLDAAQALKTRLGVLGDGRVLVLEDQLNAMELKWVLSRLDWFAGARMHATIGAFSSGVPTLGLGYTDKAQGVFAECGIGEEVVDLRSADARQVADRAAASFSSRGILKLDLASRIEGIKARAYREMSVIARQAGIAC